MEHTRIDNDRVQVFAHDSGAVNTHSSYYVNGVMYCVSFQGGARNGVPLAGYSVARMSADIEHIDAYENVSYCPVVRTLRA